MKRLIRQLQSNLSYLLEGDGIWGQRRLQVVFILIALVGITGRVWEPAGLKGVLDLAVEDILAQLPAPSLIPGQLISFLLSFFTLEALRHWIAPVAAVFFGLMAGTLYLQDIFEFPSFQRAWNYLFASFFGLGYPWLTIRDGKKQVTRNDPNTLDTIGGPGYLDIKLGNAVLLERGAGPTDILGAGPHFIRRFATIREILDLREIYRKTAEVSATTKDGIDIKIRDVEATFRIDTGRQQQRTETNPYPFAVKAVRAAVYSRSVNKEGNMDEWADTVMRAITGRVSGWVSRQRLDRLTAPSDEDPRAAIRAEFTSPEARRQLANLGAELIWVNIGHLDTPEEIDSQRVGSWQSFWRSHDKVTLAHGEALRIAYEELGRAEGQAEMLMAITKTLESLGTGDALDEHVADLVLLRIGRVLEASAGQPWMTETKGGPSAEPPKPPEPAKGGEVSHA
jgi:hypothetical protein